MVSSASIGLLINPKNQNAASHREHAETAAKALGLRMTVLTASNGGELGPAFEHGRQAKLGAILVGDDPLFDTESGRLVEAANRSGIPTMYYVRDFVLGGGLLSYGPSFDEMAFQVGVYAGRILKGAKITELPIVQPTKFELVINRKTARAIGFDIPSKLLFTADEVIE
jgi:putative ABC transport system substrate-binding protein